MTGVDEYRGGGIDATFTGGPVIAQGTMFRNNIAADGGGAAGGEYFDCKFEGNRATADIYLEGNGGGIWHACATRCVFVGNKAEGQSNMSGTGFGGAAIGSTLTNCSLIGNDALLGGGATTDCVLLNVVAFGNTPSECDGSTVASFSDIAGGWPGSGNISGDPLFVNPASDMHLTALSPCIDTCDPTSPLDPDGSRADMGAFPYDPNYCPPPFIYCTAKMNSCGQRPVISFTGAPHAGATGGFVITTSGARAGKSGLMLYSPNGTANSPFQGGTLCVAPQGLKRGIQILATGGSGGASCDAHFSIDWAAFSTGNLGGNPAPFLNTVGQRVNVQWWGRDNLVVGSLLSNAIQYEVCP